MTLFIFIIIFFGEIAKNFHSKTYMDIKQLHIIEKNNKIFVYYNLNLLSIDITTCKIIKLLQDGCDIQKVSSELGLSGHLIESKIQILKDIDNESNKLINKSKKRTVQRITIHVSNDCNLRCKYCYANGGNYHLKRKLMSAFTADNFVEFCIREFDEIGEIVFFGGEPLMNVPIMEQICVSFNDAFSNRKIKAVPSFNLITNGTILNDFIIRFIRKI